MRQTLSGRVRRSPRRLRLIVARLIVARLIVARWLGRGVLVAAIGLLGLLAVAQPASAHGEGETQEGYLLVQQALGHLAHDTSHEGIDLAMEKVDDALAAADQDGVAVAEVEQAKQALAAGQVAQARTLL